MTEHESSEMERRERQRNEPVQRGLVPLELPAGDLSKMVIARGYLFNVTAYNEDCIAYPVYDPNSDMSIGFLVRSELSQPSVWMREEDFDTFRRMFPFPKEIDESRMESVG